MKETSVLELIKQMISQDSNSFSSCEKEKNTFIKLIEDATTSTFLNEDKIVAVQNEIDTLKAQSELLIKVLKNNPNSEYSLLIDTLELHYDADFDLNRLEKKLDLQYKVREDMISELKKNTKENQARISEYTERLYSLYTTLYHELEYRLEFLKLVNMASCDTLTMTRDEIDEILKELDIPEKEIVPIEKELLFPEEHIVPTFTSYRFDDLQKKIEKAMVTLKDEATVRGVLFYNPKDPIQKKKKRTLEKEESTPNFMTAPLFESTEFVMDESATAVEDMPVEIESQSVFSEANADVEKFMKEEQEKKAKAFKELVNAFVSLGKDEEIVSKMFQGSSYTIEQFNKDCEELKKRETEPSSIPTLAFYTGIENYFKKIDLLKQYEYTFTNQSISKFNPTLCLIDLAKLERNLHVLKMYDISLKKTNNKVCIPLIMVDTPVLISRIDLMISIGEKDNIPANLEILLKDNEDIGDTIQFCKKNHIPYVDDIKKTYRDFIFDKQLLGKLVNANLDTPLVSSMVNTNSELKQIIDSSVYQTLVNFYQDGALFEEVNDADQYDAIMKQVDAILTKNDYTYSYKELLFSNKSFIRNLIHLLNAKLDAPLKDILVASFIFNGHYFLDDILNLENALEGVK